MDVVASGHAAVVNADVPPSEAAMLAAFVGSLADPAGAARALYSICGGVDPKNWERDSILAVLLPLISVRIAPEANQRWQGNQHAIMACCSDPFRVEIHLPPFYGSVSGFTAFLDGAEGNFFSHMNRMRDIAFLICELLLIGRVQFMADVKRKFGVLPDSICFRFTPEDGCSEPDVATLSRTFGANNMLIPDGYYYKHDSYARHKERVLTDRTPWLERSDIALWRGTTTGAAFTSEDVMANERIRMTALCAERPDLFDAKISHIAQVPDADRGAVERALASRGLLGGFVNMDRFRQHKYALHIDGNTSAAGFFEKMALGCCVLRVASRFEQWIEPRIRPWEHFVPIKADMSDLVTTMAMLVNAPEFARKIAENAFAFAAEADYNYEAQVFCRTLGEATGTASSVRIEPSTILFEIDFSNKGNGEAFMREGWGNPDLDSCCTEGPRAVLEVPTAISPIDRHLLTIECFAFFVPPRISKQLMAMTINGFTQQAIHDGSAQNLSFFLPPNTMQKRDTMTIEFHLPNCFAPADLDRGGDRRRLSFGFKHMVLARLP